MFEQEVRALLTARQIPFVDGTKSVSELDFFLPRQNISFDAKEKTQCFSMKNWAGARVAQEDLFIIDDLAARKLLRKAPLSFCLIKDSSSQSVTYYIYSIVDLMCIPKTRVRRPIEKSVKAFKGKWLLDLRDAAVFAELADAVEYMLTYEKNFTLIFGQHIDCWGHYPSEEIKTSGTTRVPAFWKKDAKAHT
ncbi:MAG: hypothetical protein HY961_02315 [Ignavibacteriae bacterium]|nr:hypothetical protein [Ignavibacteriota bacterium]